MLNICLVGYGKWGKLLYKKFAKQNVKNAIKKVFMSRKFIKIKCYIFNTFKQSYFYKI